MGRKRLVLFLFLLSISISYTQKKENSIDTESIVIVKSFTPSLSDAFKIKSNPFISDSISNSKFELVYNLKKIPVISTFEPNKATPLKLKQKILYNPFNTFFSGAFGNKNQLFFNISSLVEIDRSQRFGLNFYKDGFGNDIDNTILRSNQNYNEIGFNHNLRNNQYNVNTQFKFSKSLNNYFGLNENVWDQSFLNSIDPQIRRNNFKVRSDWNWYDYFFNDFVLQANLSTDNFGSIEKQIGLSTNFGSELARSNIKGKIKIQGLNTRFVSSYFEKIQEEYSQSLGSLSVFWQNTNKDLRIKIGAGVTYFLGIDQISNNLIYYPEIEIFYQKEENKIISYLNALGGAKLNSYSSLTDVNPYIAPTALLVPTFNKYNIQLGIRSRLASVLNFDFGLIFDEVENYNFYQRLPFDNENELESYRLSNAFESKYLDLSFYGFNASIIINMIKDNFIRFEASYRFFDTQQEEILWNIPSLQANWESQIKWNDHLAFSFKGSMWGDRSAAVRPIFLDQELSSDLLINEEILPIFIRSSAHITYKLTKQFDLFFKGRFNSKGIHGRWSYYPEPPFLILGGITYKFDFQY